MIKMQYNRLFQEFKQRFTGAFYTEEERLFLYATDASIYKVMPLAVAVPNSKESLRMLVKWASEHRIPLIARGTGTSLAGQVVGEAVIVDLSVYFKAIRKIDETEKTVVVEPGVIRDELNTVVAGKGLYFGPETSTSNRATIGGMFGNNSAGAGSLRYGTTRESIVSVKAFLADGSDVEFGPLTKKEYDEKLKLSSLEGDIYRYFNEILTNTQTARQIDEAYPDRSLHRRNMGYPLDELLHSCVFDEKSDKPFNIAQFLAGTEGTLAIVYELKLKLFPVAPPQKALVVIQFAGFYDIFRANLEVLSFRPYAIELMDDKILKLTEGNILQQQNRFFVKGTPKAILIVELAQEQKEAVIRQANEIIDHLKAKHLGYEYTIVDDAEKMKRVWNLRKAGLGVLSNMKGDSKPVGFIEDTAVPPKNLEAYIRDIEKMLQHYGLECVYYAHIGAGELHLRPILNLKSAGGVETMHAVAWDTARIVKKYRGSLSGEHGDGLLRSEFIPYMFGNEVYDVLKQVKAVWDKNHLFNPGKIVASPPMDKHLRNEYPNLSLSEWFDYSKTIGFYRAVERCNGSGDCRKNTESGGVMCPSFQATQDEKNTPRGRANVIREYMLKDNGRLSKASYRKVLDALSSCLACKSCKSECPSSIDITKLRAELLQDYYTRFGFNIRSFLIANIDKLNHWASLVPNLYNALIANGILTPLAKRMMGFAEEREIPKLSPYTLRRWIAKNKASLQVENPKRTICFFVDEFTNYLDVKIGESALRLLTALGYKVIFINHLPSGRAYLSKGFLKKAKRIANLNIFHFKEIIDAGIPIVGVEPSAILTLRDEYLDLAYDEYKTMAKKMAKQTKTIDEFLAEAYEQGEFSAEMFTAESQKIVLHTHCYQKVLSNPALTKQLLSIPQNYTVEEIKSGCCGMAGSFGYEKKNFKLSMQIGELSVLPTVRSQSQETIVAAPGTSCRQQIKDGTQRIALHPVEILEKALRR
jgi:FAD/FMN-containing dehydrogenase/Fe-S oxidoreductase